MQPKCLKGKLSSIKFVGLIPDLENSDFALDYCSDSAKYQTINECSKEFLDRDGIRIEYKTECQGQSDC